MLWQELAGKTYNLISKANVIVNVITADIEYKKMDGK